MQYSHNILELDGLSSFMAKVFRKRAKPFYLTRSEQAVLLKHIEGYLLVGEDKKILARILAKLRSH